MPYVYIFQNGKDNYFKIGRTKSTLEKRKKELSTGNPKPLTLFDFIETDQDSLVENYLHTKFYKYLCTEGDAKEFYFIEPENLHKGIEEAKKFLAEYLSALEESEKYAKCDPNGTLLQPNDEIQEIYKDLRRVKEEIASLEFEKEILENKLKNKIGDTDGIEGIASWKTQIRSFLQQESLKEQYPDIYRQFSIEKKFRFFRLL